MNNIIYLKSNNNNMTEISPDTPKTVNSSSNIELKELKGKPSDASEIDLVEMKLDKVLSCPMFLSQFGWFFFILAFIAY